MGSFGAITAIEPDYLQFGSADWFWERWLNSYALQVEPACRLLKRFTSSAPGTERSLRPDFIVGIRLAKLIMVSKLSYKNCIVGNFVNDSVFIIYSAGPVS